MNIAQKMRLQMLEESLGRITGQIQLEIDVAEESHESEDVAVLQEAYDSAYGAMCVLGNARMDAVTKPAKSGAKCND